VQSAPIASLQVREPPYRDLHERKVDLVLGPIVNPLSDEAIQAESLFEDHFVIVAGSKNPLTRRRTIKLADLLEERWILPPLDTTVGVACVNAFRLSGLQVPERKIESSAILLQIGLLATEDLVTIFPSSLVRFGAERFAIQALPIKIAVRPPPIGIITLKGRTISPAVQRFIDAVREVAKLSLPRK
jgi:DNA-binding transcriptional LysR family regulator